MADVVSDHLRRERPPGGHQQQDEQPDVENGDADCQGEVAVLYNTARSRSSPESGRSHNLWSRTSHAIIAALAKIVAALSRQGPMVADNCQIAGYARLTAPAANAAINTLDIPAASRHGRLA